LVGVGALNIDLIIGRSRLHELARSRPLAGERGRFADPCELFGRLDEMTEVLDLMRPFSAQSLGGSAFNVVQAAIAARPSLRLGVVGVLPCHQPEFDRWLQAKHVDARFVLRVPIDEPGLCASLPCRDGQFFKLYPGANTRFAAAVDTVSVAVARYLSRARIIYVSPFFDDDAAGCLLKLVTTVASQSARPLICFDPGPCWSRFPSAAVRDLCRSSDLLFVNDVEWRTLGGLLHERWSSPLSTIVVKEKRATVILRRRRRGWHKTAYPISNPLAVDDIEDATGAGDVFAAGFLVGCLAGLAEPGCVQLGHRLMRAKLFGVGTARHDRFARLCRLRAQPAPTNRLPKR
jgi:sugar/nucleoside kinase (ribokinase family)